MTVLIVIGILIGCYLLFRFITYINNKTYAKYKFECIDIGSFGLYAIITGLAYFGNSWYLKELRLDGDILNGILIMSFAAILFILILLSNIKKTSFFVGIGITLLQTIILVPLSAVSLVLLLIATAYFSQTKPVYNINSK